MEIPSKTLEEIKCDICQDYLSCSPVFSKNNGFTLCGRCYASEEKQDSAIRNLKYEAVARLLNFPCKYIAHGCKITVPYAENYQEKVHELICEYKKYECPIIETCDWSGQRKNILEHCQDVHSEHVMVNPCHLMHDIKQFSAKAYIIHCFDVLFLLYTKICIATGKIYHAVKLLDAPDKVTQFKYVLDIKRDELIFSRPGKVTIQTDESSSIVTSINMLLEFLNGFSGTIFTIRLIKVAEDSSTTLQEVKEAVNEVEEPSASSVTVEQVRTALNDLKTELASRVQLKNVWGSLALEDVDDRFCRNKARGCNFSDIDVKCQKHEEFFCSFRTWCWTCWSPVELTSRDAWYAHYLAAHSRYTHEKDEFFEIKSTGITGRTVFVKTSIGYVNCRYYLNNSSFKIYIWSTSLSKNLSKYHVDLELDTDCMNSDNYQLIRIESVLSETWDWYGIINAENCVDPWDTKDFKMSLKITKE